MSVEDRHIVVIGGTKGLGLAVASAAISRGYAVTVTGRSAPTAELAAGSLGGGVVGLPCNLNDGASIKGLFSQIPRVDHLVLVAVERDHNEIRSFRPEDALRTSVAKTVGYATAVHCALDKFAPDGSVVMFGGISALRPLPGSTTISMANAAVVGLMNSLATQIAPVRVNTITPGLVAGTDAVDVADPIRREAYEKLRERTPGKRLPSPDDIVQATFALIDNPGLNAVDLVVDSGMRIV
jgi:NAD(P)-dependent dehydrogenase (short-subunit alcohol dehydrogenase family)